MENLKVEVENININLIKPYWRNPRHNEAVVEHLKESIKKFGFNVPLVVDKEHVIITGHSRYKALLQLGFTEVPCIVKKDLSETEARKYRITDNKLSEMSSWNEEYLRKELMELENVVGFTTDEIKEMIEYSSKRGVTEEDIERVSNKLDNKFIDAVEKHFNDKVTLLCPHCFKEFELTKGDVLKI